MSDRAPVPASDIHLCPSPPHRAILRLTRLALGGTPDLGLQDDLRASDPQDLVRIAFETYVHVVVATAFDTTPELTALVPPDLPVFFSEMQHANRRRNVAILAQIASIGTAFHNAGISGMVLKGGAELIAPTFPDPAFRFLSDVDILLPEHNLDRAVDCLNEIGAMSDPDDPTAYHDHHHVAPLSRPDWPVPVELHRSLGRMARARPGLASDALLDAAQPTDLDGITRPAPHHRLAHSVFHAQIQSRHHRMGTLSLRDAMEFQVLTRHLSARDITAAEALFTTPEDRAAWRALDAADRMIFADSVERPALPSDATTWARTALLRYGRPKRQRVRAMFWTVREFVAEVLFDPARRRHHLHQLTHPQALRRAIAHHWDARRRNR